jgi:hypothetical protein
MPYVKISDPNIIDVAAWHQVINVVNQHSDSINAMTNNFGVQGSGTVSWNSDNDTVHEYTPGSQKMLYGRTKLDTSVMEEINNNQIFYGTVTFEDQISGTGSFSSRPIITGTLQFGHSSIEALDDTNHNAVFNLFAVTKDGFSFRVTRATSTSAAPSKLTGSFYLCWNALGPK